MSKLISILFLAAHTGVDVGQTCGKLVWKTRPARAVTKAYLFLLSRAFANIAPPTLFQLPPEEVLEEQMEKAREAVHAMLSCYEAEIKGDAVNALRYKRVYEAHIEKTLERGFDMLNRLSL